MNHKVLLQEKLRSMFPDELERNSVIETLGTYGIEKHEKEPIRVRLSVLKLSGSDLSEVEKWTRYAKKDFRDILTWAEYPRQSKKWSMPDGPKKQKLVEADKLGYQEWLKT